MNAGIIVLCRYASRRLPGKILREIRGRTVLGHIVDRLQRGAAGAPITVATSDDATDDAIARYCRRAGIDCFRGPLADVAGRFLACAEARGYEYAVRINGDNLFADPDTLRSMLSIARTGAYDFVTNVPGRTFPYGMSVEIVRTDFFRKAMACVVDAGHREHVTSYVYEKPELGRRFVFENAEVPEARGLKLALDTEEDLRRAELMIARMDRAPATYVLAEIATMAEQASARCVLCGAGQAELCATISRKPEREVDYGIPPELYSRRILRCTVCRVYFNDHGLLPDTFYGGAYNDSAYGSRFRARYDAVMALPPEQSDNKHRALRLDEALLKSGRTPPATRVLDIGSGLCVFSAEMRKRGYETHVIDPDPRAVRHALDVVGVRGGTVGSLEALPKPAPFELVTLNKVLEHVPDPQNGLRSAAEFVAPRGMIYVELPDGEAAAAAEGFTDCSEFFVEHFTVYGPASLRWLIEHAGLTIREMGRIHEPSGKYTIFAIAGRPGDG